MFGFAPCFAAMKNAVLVPHVSYIHGELRSGTTLSALPQTFLLEKGADVNAKQYIQNCQGVTALLKAAAGGYTEIVKILLENGADVYAKTGAGNTALMKARQRGHEAVVRLIINHMNRMTLLVVEKGRTKDENPLATHSHREIAKHIASFLL